MIGGRDLSRKVSREAAMKLLFEINIRMDEIDDVLNNYIEENKPDESDKKFIEDIVRGTIEDLKEIDASIERHSKGWKLNRLGKVDLAILRMAVFELKHSDTPKNIVINEAVELAKKFGTEKSGAFVNGVLAGVLKEG